MRRVLLTGWMAMLAAGSCPAIAAEALPARSVPVEAFFQAPEVDAPVLSPQGDAIAVLLRSPAGRQQLAVADAVTPNKLLVVAVFDDADVVDARWVNNQRLVMRLSQGVERTLPDGSGLYAVDRDGSAGRELVLGREELLAFQGSSSVPALPGEHELLRTLSDGSADVIVRRITHDSLTSGSNWHVGNSTPLRLDTRTGRVKPVVSGMLPAHVNQWSIDDQGVAHAAFAQTDAGTDVLTPTPAGAWASAGLLPSSPAQPLPQDFCAVAADGRIYLSRVTPGVDGAYALYRIGIDGGHVDAQALVSLKGFDFTGSLIEDSRRHAVLGVRYVTDAPGTAWFDPAMKALQAKVDAMLPGLANEISPARCGCSTRVLVSARSDHQPPVFFLYDTETAKLTPIGGARPAIAARQMADTDFVRVKARDGLELPVYVTRPTGKGPWPTVVLAHDGPWQRGTTWQWNAPAQFLASRGYLVLEPEYRGSTGYGWAHFTAGFRQWGGKMQDDLADTARWAIGKGFADVHRICIAGNGYGGYAALMGLARDRDLYRCAVARSAITDIDQETSTVWRDASDVERAYGIPALVGEPGADASPIRIAARITRPVLLAHGREDRRVLVTDAGRLQAALDTRPGQVTWLEYKGESQGFGTPVARIDFYRQLEKFLDTNIGADATKP